MGKLIILRGNSGSGKTTVAKELQKKFGYNTMPISQDEIRRNILWVKDGIDTKALPLMIELLKYGYEHSDIVILEGIMHEEWYNPLFKVANELYGSNVYSYYFDIPFEETIRRHQTRSKRVVGNNKMKLLYGTGNLAKLSAMRNRLEQLDIELIGLNDLKVEGKNVPEVKEDGNTPLENARLKAMVYYEAFQIPVFSCDSGLYFDNVPDEVQPGVHVRNVNGKCLSDDEMIDYYSGLVKAYGNLVARYRNAICFVMDNTHIYEAMEPSMESEKFILTDKPHSTVRKEGFPLDSISLDIKTNKYYYDLPEDKLEQVAVGDGFLEFFKNILNLN